MKLSTAEAKLPEPPAGSSTARRLQDPGHVDIVKALVNVPSIQEMGLKKEGEQLYDKMMKATTRGLNSSSGGQYRRYGSLCKKHALILVRYRRSTWKRQYCRYVYNK